MKIVKFKNGKYGIREGSWLTGYSFLEHKFKITQGLSEKNKLEKVVYHNGTVEFYFSEPVEDIKELEIKAEQLDRPELKPNANLEYPGNIKYC